MPECSCKRCLESMLREFQPDLLAGEFRVTRLTNASPRSRANRRRKAA